MHIFFMLFSTSGLPTTCPFQIHALFLFNNPLSPTSAEFYALSCRRSLKRDPPAVDHTPKENRLSFFWMPSTVSICLARGRGFLALPHPCQDADCLDSVQLLFRQSLLLCVPTLPGALMPTCAFRDQRTTLWSWFSPSTLTSIPEIKLWSPDLSYTEGTSTY